MCSYAHAPSDGNIRYFEYENDKFEFLSEYKSADPQRGIAFVPRRGINVHENEVMRAYKTVNDTYIEPISFTVPRRAETFQSDIFPPAFGLKPAMTAKEWFDGKTAVPPKIDLESIYEGNAPVEVPADYKPPAAVSAPAPAPAPAPKKEPEPAPAPVRAPATMADQKSSISAMANKFQDDEEEEEDDDAETSSFEEISRPAPRTTTLPARSPTKPEPVSTTAPPAQAKPASPVKSPQAAAPAPAISPAAAATATSQSSPVVEASLEQIKQLLVQQATLIGAQNDKITAQTQMIARLTAEVETLKKRVANAGTQDQSERIRQLELELEAARS
jgi:coronin-1B/1C/6